MARKLRLALLAALALPLAGCGGSPGDGPPPITSFTCLDDSKHCIEQRQGALRTLVSDKDKRWVREPATPQAYASGVRLFAFKTRKRDLTCDELAVGKREADNAGAVLRGPGGAGLAPGQISRGAMLGTEVSGELGKEMRRRCRV